MDASQARTHPWQVRRTTAADLPAASALWIKATDARRRAIDLPARGGVPAHEAAGQDLMAADHTVRLFVVDAGARHPFEGTAGPGTQSTPGVPATRTAGSADDGSAGLAGMAISMHAIEGEGAGPDRVPGLLHISSVAVDPAYWGQGIGGLLLAAVLACARIDGYERAQLFTHESNVAAQALYRRFGFEPSERTKVDDGAEQIRRWDLSRF